MTPKKKLSKDNIVVINSVTEKDIENQRTVDIIPNKNIEMLENTLIETYDETVTYFEKTKKFFKKNKNYIMGIVFFIFFWKIILVLFCILI